MYVAQSLIAESRTDPCYRVPVRIGGREGVL
jgi:hypothetical protein